MLMSGQVIDPTLDCFDYRMANQTCENDVMVDYYFYNITNKEAVSATKS